MDLNHVRLAAPYVVGAATTVVGIFGAVKAAPVVYARIPTAEAVFTEVGHAYHRVNASVRATAHNATTAVQTTVHSATTSVQAGAQSAVASARNSVRTRGENALQAVRANPYVQTLQRHCAAIETFQRDFFTELNRPTVGKTAAPSMLSALVVTIGAIGIAVSTPSLYVAIPAASAAIVGIGVIFGIYNLYTIAAREQNIQLFKRHLPSTIYSHVAFLASVNTLSLAALGVMMLDKQTRGSGHRIGGIIINGLVG